MTKHEEAEVELTRPQEFSLMIGDTDVKVTASTEDISLLLNAAKEQGWNLGAEPTNPEFLGWTIEEILEAM